MNRIILKIIAIFLFSGIAHGSNGNYVLLISFDGFRWDYANRGITPNLERFKSEGVSATSLKPAFPSSTFPNHLAIITGMHPSNHGIISNYFKNPFTGDSYGLNLKEAIEDSRFYLGEEFWTTAKRYGIKTASYFWPGSEQKNDYRRPDYFEAYEHNRPYMQRIEGVIKWLSLPHSSRPRFLTLYFDDTDTKGHAFGVNSGEVNKSIAMLDSLLGIVENKLAFIGLKDSVNIIVLSDHGMADVAKEKSVNIDSLLIGLDYQSEGYLTTMSFNSSDIDAVFDRLIQYQDILDVYYKEEVPQYYHYSNHPAIMQIVAIAKPGWIITTNKSPYKSELIGVHGWDNNWLDMHGIFFAKGPDFKNAYRTGTLSNLDIYPLLCKLLGIPPRSNIDGSLKNIEFILK